MLKIRLSRTGKNRQPTFRLVVQEHTAPIKGKFVEEIGYYRPTAPDKPFTINSERVKYWISVGARPSDMAATLLKKQGFEGMERYMEPRDKKRKSRSEDAEGGRAEAPGASEASKAAADSASEASKAAADSASEASRAAADSASEASASSEEKAEAKKEEPATAAKNAELQQEPAPAPADAPQESPKSES